MTERGWLGEKSGQGYYKRVGKEKEIHAIDLNTFEYHPAVKVKFPSAEAAKNIEDLARAPARRWSPERTASEHFCGSSTAICSSTPPNESPRSPTKFSRSTAPCAGATPTSSGRSNCGTRWASKKSASAWKRTSEIFPKTCRKCANNGADSFYKSTLQSRSCTQRYTSTSLDASYKPFAERPSLAEIKKRRQRSQVELRSILNRSGRRRPVLRVPQQNELAGRRSDRHDLQRPQGVGEEFRRHGHRQSGREFLASART